MNRKKSRKSIILGLTLILLLTFPVGVYAYDGTYHDFRDAEISLYLPEGWSSEELADQWSENGQYENILYAFDDSGLTLLELNVVYGLQSTGGDYVYFHSVEQDAMDYYDAYGMAAIEGYYEQLEECGEFALDEAVFFEGQWNSFLMVPVSGTMVVDGQQDAFEHVIYLTAEMAEDDNSLVSSMLIFSLSEDLLWAQMETEPVLAREIADEFYDYGYVNVFAGTEEMIFSVDVEESSNTVIGVVSILVTLGIIIMVIVVIIKRIAGRKKAQLINAATPLFHKLADGLQSVQDDFASGGKAAGRGREKKKSSRQAADFGKPRQQMVQTSTGGSLEWRKRFRRPEQSAEQKKRAAEAEARYMASLETLRKSGLLTREELREMIEKHNRRL